VPPVIPQRYIILFYIINILILVIISIDNA